MNISEGEHFMKKTKIICTLGPSTDKKELLVDMIRSGMDPVSYTHLTLPTTSRV